MEWNSMWRLILAATLAVAGFAATVRLFEGRFAFFPLAGETTTPAAFGIPYERVELTTADGRRLGAWSMEGADATATILYFHGNGGNLSVWAPVLAAIREHGYAVYAFDYRGYGRSSGRPTERGLYLDVEAAVRWVSDARRADRPLVYWGRSLGTTMAAYAATLGQRPNGLVLEAGFADARTLLRGSGLLAAVALFSSYRFPTARFAADAAVPTLVLHGDRDSVVPFTNGQDLYDRLREPKQFVTIPNGDHNDLVPVDPQRYWGTIAEWIASLPGSAWPP
jgi:fermentation-respiration switch protein FrsA (DUF1100 family)